MSRRSTDQDESAAKWGRYRNRVQALMFGALALIGSFGCGSALCSPTSTWREVVFMGGLAAIYIVAAVVELRRSREP